MLNFHNHRKLVLLVVAWGLLCLTSQTLIHLFDVQYDSAGGLYLIWWFGQLVLLPVIGLSELLSVIGIRVSGFQGYIFLTIVIVSLIILPFILGKSKPENLG